jgi:hypothetical protein
MGKHLKGDYRRRGRSLRGLRALEKRRFVRGDKYSLIAALGENGILSNTVVEGSFNFESFWDFVFGNLIHKMSPYPGPNSVLVLDNARIHHSIEFQLRMEMFGLRVIYLPAYSPDYNPIELCFSQIRSYFRRNAEVIENLAAEFIMMEDIITDSCNQISSENAINYMNHCGYIV